MSLFAWQKNMFAELGRVYTAAFIFTGLVAATLIGVAIHGHNQQSNAAISDEEKAMWRTTYVSTGVIAAILVIALGTVQGYYFFRLPNNPIFEKD